MRANTYRLESGLARRIRAEHAAGVSILELARRHDLSRGTIRAIVRCTRHEPALSPEQLDALAAVVRATGKTADEIFDIAFQRGLNSMMEVQ